MTSREYWEAFEKTGRIQAYINYKRSLGAMGAIDNYDDENDDGRFGNMGTQDGRGRSGDYPFDA